MLSQPQRRSSDFVASPRKSRDIWGGGTTRPQTLRPSAEGLRVTLKNLHIGFVSCEGIEAQRTDKTP